MVLDFHKPAYKITFEGEFFLESVGGYVKQAELSFAESTRQDKFDKTQRENTANMVILTRWIAGGTIVAAIYYGIEICKLVHHFFLPTGVILNLGNTQEITL